MGTRKRMALGRDEDARVTMGAAAVQAKCGQKYEETMDPRRMLTHKLLNEAIRNDWENVRGFLPARTATSMRYDGGATKAKAWNEGESEVSIDLPLQNGWYVPDGNQFAIPNGRKSSSYDPDALHLVRHQYDKFSGSLVRGFSCFGSAGDERIVYADYWSGDSGGVALIGRPEERSSLGTSERSSLGEATALLVDIADPKALVQRAEQLETAAKELADRLGAVLSPEAYARLIKPTLDKATYLRELAILRDPDLKRELMQELSRMFLKDGEQRKNEK